MCLKTLWIPEYLSSIRTLKKNDPVPGVRAVCHEHLSILISLQFSTNTIKDLKPEVRKAFVDFCDT